MGGRFSLPGITIFLWSDISGLVAFRFEADLREPVATWLRDAGFEVRLEVPILGRRADLVGSRGTSVTAIEMKNASMGRSTSTGNRVPTRRRSRPGRDASRCGMP